MDRSDQLDKVDQQEIEEALENQGHKDQEERLVWVDHPVELEALDLPAGLDHR